jgi:hypothetical protein
MTMYTVTYITQNVRSKKTVWEENLNSSATADAPRLARDRSFLDIPQRGRRVARRKAANG